MKAIDFITSTTFEDKWVLQEKLSKYISPSFT